MFEAVRFVLRGNGYLHPRAFRERQGFVQLNHIASHCAFVSHESHLTLYRFTSCYTLNGDRPSREHFKQYDRSLFCR